MVGAVVAGRRERDDGLLVVRWSMVPVRTAPHAGGGWTGAQEDRAGGCALECGERAKACVCRCRRIHVLRCVGTIGAEMLVWSAMRRLLSTSQPATRRVCQASAAVSCWNPWTPWLTRGHYCAGVANRRLVPVAYRLGFGYGRAIHQDCRRIFMCRQVPISLFSLPKHAFFSHYFTPPSPPLRPNSGR